MWRRTGLLLALLFVADTARAQVASEGPEHARNQVLPFATESRLPIDVQGTGSGLEHDLEAGEKAPGFSLEGSAGARVGLDDLKGQWTLLVFTYNHRVLGSYKGIDDDLRKAGVRLYGVSQDGARTLTSYAAGEKLPFVILSDPTRQVSQTFGMYDAEIDEIEPGFVLLDPQGTVQLARRGQWLAAGDLLQLTRRSVLGA